MRSEATTVQDYIASLPKDRQEALVSVRETILKNLPNGYVETMNWGMICYEIPLNIYPDTYNKKPLMYAALASQKNHMAVYMTGLYAIESLEQKFVADYEKTGKKLDKGASCIRFKKLEDLPLDVIGKYIAAISPDQLIEAAEAAKQK